MLHESYAGAVKLYTDGSVLPGPPGSAAAACVAPELGAAVQRKLTFASSSTTAELVGLHLAADVLGEHAETTQAVVLCDSRAALLRLQSSQKNGPLVQQLAKKLRDLQREGRSISLHWVPAHVGLKGNEQADALAKAAHSAGTLVYTAATKHDEARHCIARLTNSQHPDPNFAAGKRRQRIPSRTMSRADSSLLFRLRTDCAFSAARRHLWGKTASPLCPHCGELANTAHELLHCGRHAAERATLLRRYKELGLACNSKEELLFPSSVRGQGAALTALLKYLHATDLAAQL